MRKTFVAAPKTPLICKKIVTVPTPRYCVSTVVSVHHKTFGNSLVVIVLVVVVQGDAVEILERIGDYLTHGSSEARVHWYTLPPACTNIYTSAFFDVPEVDRVNRSSCVGNHWGLHMPQQCPGDRLEEHMTFHI